MSRESLRILVLEDDADLRDVFASVLGDSGFHVTAVTSYDEAVVELERRDVALVLTDYRPGLAAHELFWPQVDRVVRAAAPGRVGLVAMWKLDREDVLRRGIAFLLPIPCDIAALLGAVSEHARAGAASAGEQRAIAAYFDALSRKDWEALAAVCADDVVYNVPGNDPTFSQTVVGREPFKRFAAEVFARFPDATFSVEAVLALPTAVVARWRSRWTAPDGRTVDDIGAIWFRFDDAGKIASIGVRLDLQRLWTAFGTTHAG